MIGGTTLLINVLQCSLHISYLRALTLYRFFTDEFIDLKELFEIIRLL